MDNEPPRRPSKTGDGDCFRLGELRLIFNHSILLSKCGASKISSTITPNFQQSCNRNTGYTENYHWLVSIRRKSGALFLSYYTMVAIRLFQASCPSSLWSVMSVTPFCQPRRLVRSAGKHVHRPTKFFYRGSCCLERTSTRPTLTAHQSPTVPIQAENSSVPTSLATTLHDSSENNMLKSETL